MKKPEDNLLEQILLPESLGEKQMQKCGGLFGSVALVGKNTGGMCPTNTRKQNTRRTCSSHTQRKEGEKTPFDERLNV